MYYVNFTLLSVMGSSPSNLIRIPHRINRDFQSVVPFPDGQQQDDHAVRERGNSMEFEYHQTKARKFSNSNLEPVTSSDITSPLPSERRLEHRPSSSGSVLSNNYPPSVEKRIARSVRKEERPNSAASHISHKSHLSYQRSDQSFHNSFHDDSNDSLTENEFLYTEGQSKRKMMADFEDACTQITDFLFVGGEKVASSWDTILAYGITHIVNCCNMVVPDYFTSNPGMKYLTLNVVDGRQDDISWFLPEVINFIESGRLGGNKVLVHCEKGISRSCSFVIAYIMWATGDSWKDAFEFVKSRRLICAPNTGFTCNLIEIDEMLHGEARNQPLIFRCATHLPHDINTIVLKLCRNSTSRRLMLPSRSLLDQNGVFVIRPTSSIKGLIYIWQGRNAHDRVVEVTMHLCKQMIGSFLSGNTIEIIKSGAETPEFLRILVNDTPHDPKTHYFYFDLYKMPLPPPSQSSGSSPSLERNSPDKLSRPSAHDLMVLATPYSARPSSRQEGGNTGASLGGSATASTSGKMDSARDYESRSPLVTSRSRIPSLQGLELPSPLPLARDSPSPAPIRTRESALVDIEKLKQPLFVDRQSSKNLNLQLNISKLHLDDTNQYASTTSMSTGSGSSGRPKTKPHLFGLTVNEAASKQGGLKRKWTSLGVYDDGDLDSDGVMLLVCPRPPHYLWIGENVNIDSITADAFRGSTQGGLEAMDIDPEEEGDEVEGEGRDGDQVDEEEKLKRRIRKWLLTVGNVDLLECVTPAQHAEVLSEELLVIERDQSESESFWAAFEEGF